MRKAFAHRAGATQSSSTPDSPCRREPQERHRLRAQVITSDQRQTSPAQTTAPRALRTHNNRFGVPPADLAEKIIAVQIGGYLRAACRPPPPSVTAARVPPLLDGAATVSIPAPG